MQELSILYIEDNPYNMRLVRKILGSSSHNLLEAVDGFSGIEMVKIHLPDLILMDMNLPDIDGLEVTQRIKATPDLAHIPIIALTANAMYGDREHYLEKGCDGYLSKPITRIEFMNTLRYYLTAVSTQ